MKSLIIGLAMLWVATNYAATPDAIKAAIERGCTYLMQQQHADGSFSDPHMPALTALPLWALSKTPHALNSACTNAARYVVSTQQKDGGFYIPKPGRGSSGLGNYNTSVSVSALYESRLAPMQAILNARTYIASTQLTGDDTMAGGFGYDRVGRRRYADLNNTVYAVDAMRRTQGAEDFRPAGQKRADLNWEKALAFVEQMQVKEGSDQGGFVYNVRTPQAGTSTNSTGKVRLNAYGSMTYAGVLALVSAQIDASDPRVKSALSFAGKHWTLDENPGMGSQGLFFYYDIMARSLSASRVKLIPTETGRQINWRQELADKLLSLQRPDGSWVNENNRFWENDSVLVTSFAILALSECL